MTLKLFSGAWGKMIHEKKPEAKTLVTLPFKNIASVAQHTAKLDMSVTVRRKSQ
jgi:hypothetical protein